MSKRRLLLAAIILPLVAFFGVGAAAVPAEAAPTTVSSISITAKKPDCSGTGVKLAECGETELTSQQRDELYATSYFMPMSRWKDMGFHTRLNWFNAGNAAMAVSQRAIASWMLSLGNGVWGSASDWARSATTFDATHGVFGYQMDKLVGSVGGVLKDTPLIYLAVLLLVVGAGLWSAMRTRGKYPWGKTMQAVFVVALIGVMTTAASNGTSGTMPTTYNPRPGSPVWVGAVTSKTIDTVAGSIADPLITGATSIATADTKTNGWDCDKMLDASLALASKYTSPSAGSEAVTNAMTRLWAATALQTYKTVQFGDANDDGDFAYCHLLEIQTAASDYSKLQLLSQSLYGESISVPGNPNRADLAPSNGGTYIPGPILKVTSDNEVNDRILVALGACRPMGDGSGDFHVAAGWGKRTGTERNGDPWITPENCKQAWSAKNADELRDKGDPFNVDGEASDAAKFTSDAGVLNYLAAIHGGDIASSGAGVTSAIIYLVGALIGGGVFLVFSLLVLATKLMLLLMVAMLFALLLFSLFRRGSVADTLGAPAKRFLTTSIFAFGSSMLLVLLATVSLAMSTVGQGLFGADSTGGLLWTAISPLLTIVGVHHLFTKVFKMPSPVHPRGMAAWGIAGGAIAGAVAGRVATAGKRVGSKVGNQAGAKLLPSFMHTDRMSKIAKGAGDAGPRADEPTSSKEGAAAAETAAAEGGAEAVEQEQPTRKELRAAKQAARKEFREKNPSALTRRIDARKGRMQEVNAERAQALQALALDGSRKGVGLPPGVGADEAFLTESARKKRLSLTNATDMSVSGAEDGALFAMAPPAIAWGDLNKEGQRQATLASLRNRKEARQAQLSGLSDFQRGKQATRNALVNVRENAQMKRSLTSAELSDFKQARSAARDEQRNASRAERATRRAAISDGTYDRAVHGDRTVTKAVKRASGVAAAAAKPAAIAAGAAAVTGFGLAPAALAVGGAVALAKGVKARKEHKSRKQREKDYVARELKAMTSGGDIKAAETSKPE